VSSRGINLVWNLKSHSGYKWLYGAYVSFSPEKFFHTEGYSLFTVPAPGVFPELETPLIFFIQAKRRGLNPAW
jgi:hypothetical protein